MPHCYYTCDLLPLDLVIRSGYSPIWLGNRLRDAAAPARRDALSIHPMICPYVTKLVAAAEDVLGDASPDGGSPNGDAATGSVSNDDCLIVPGGCDAMRRMGDLMAAVHPERVFVLSMPRTSGPEVVKTLAADLRRLEEWLAARLSAGAERTDPASEGAAAAAAADDAAADATAAASPRSTPLMQEPPTLDYPSAPQPGGVFLVAGPLSDDSLLRLVGQLGVGAAGLESCTSRDRWKPLAAGEGSTPTSDNAAGGATNTDGALDHAALATRILEIGMCPRRSTADRRDHLVRRLDQTRPSSIIYARQSFCDPGAYDALLVSRLAEERGLPYLEIEVDFPFDANGPLRTRVEAFLEAQLLDDDLLDNDLFDEED